jgi:hypothetical protein
MAAATTAIMANHIQRAALTLKDETTIESGKMAGMVRLLLRQSARRRGPEVPRAAGSTCIAKSELVQVPLGEASGGVSRAARAANALAADTLQTMGYGKVATSMAASRPGSRAPPGGGGTARPVRRPYALAHLFPRRPGA